MAKLLTCMIPVLFLSLAVRAEDTVLIDFSAADAASRLAKNGKSGVAYQVVGNALEITCTPGNNRYPGVAVKPDGDVWNLSAYGKVEVDLENLSKQAITVCLRVDNAGDWKKNPWNAENVRVKAGKKVTGTVIFGYSWGKKAYKLDPKKVSQVLIFSSKPKQETKFRVTAIRAAGKPGAKPKGIERLRPMNGAMIDFKTYPKDRIQNRDTETTIVNGAARIKFPAGVKNKWPGASFRTPKSTIWDLSDYNQVEFKLRNPGDKPVRAMCRVDNRNANGTRNCANAIANIAPGAERTVIVPFVTDKIFDANEKRGKTGFVFDSSKVIGVLVFTDRKDHDQELILSGVKGSVAPPPAMPEWLGKRPPVQGDWEVTFEDDFSGETIDRTKGRRGNNVALFGADIPTYQASPATLATS